MIPLSEYISMKIVPFLIGLASALSSFGIANIGCLIAIKKKIKVIKVFFVTCCLALLLVLPQFICDYLFYYPEVRGPVNIVLFSLGTFPNPLLIFIYYFLCVRVLGLSRANVFRILEPTILLQYIILVIFLGMCDLWGSLFASSSAWPDFFDYNLLAMICTNILAVAALIFVRDLYKRRGKYIEIPYGYPMPDTRKELLRVFFSVSCYYIILVAIMSFVFINRFNNKPNIWFALLFFILTGIIFYRFFEVIQHRRLNIIEWKAAATDDYIRSLISVNEEFRSLKHDFYNILQVYGGYISTQDLDGLQKYHESTVKTTTRVGTSLDIMDSLLPRKSLYTLFNLKVQLAREHDVDMKIIQPEFLIRVTMNDLDLCRIMANLIDNAIDAAGESADKKVIVECVAVSKTMMNMTISNSTAGTINIEQIGQGSATPNPTHMEYGLVTVRNIIALHEGCSIKLGFEDSMFIARVCLVTDS